jgi:hypothetical protein
LEFKSIVNPWDQNEKYKEIQFMEFDLNCGNILSIPSYWWNSLKYEKDTIILEFNYHTLINKISNIADFGRYYLQQQNIIKPFSKSLKKEEALEEVLEEKED